MVNQAKLRSYRTAPKYMFGFQVPRNYAHAMELDSINKNTRWKDSVTLEMDSHKSYDTFHDKGKDYKIPEGYKIT